MQDYFLIEINRSAGKTKRLVLTKKIIRCSKFSPPKNWLLMKRTIFFRGGIIEAVPIGKSILRRPWNIT